MYQPATNEQITQHMSRYIDNRNKRTNETWYVVKTWVSAYGYHRAIITNGVTNVRVYYRAYIIPERPEWGGCWVVA